MIEMVIDSIRVSLSNYQRVVILKQKENDRYLPIWIGPAEADSIAVRLQDVSVPRPLTHDLLITVIKELGASIDHIVISGLDNDTFFSKIVLKKGSDFFSIDSRPSDAIAVAVRSNVPVFVKPEVLEKAGVRIDNEKGIIIGSDKENQNLEKTVPVDQKELDKLSAFTDFIDSLDLDDLGKGTVEKKIIFSIFVKNKIF